DQRRFPRPRRRPPASVRPARRVRRAALPAGARRHRRIRPEAGDRMTWQLRRATTADLDAVMGLESATFGTDAWSPAAMSAELAEAHTHYLVAVALDSDSIDGYAGLLAPQGGAQADVQTIAVAERARRRGLGRTLMQALIAEARRRGAD